MMFRKKQQTEAPWICGWVLFQEQKRGGLRSYPCQADTRRIAQRDRQTEIECHHLDLPAFVKAIGQEGTKT